MYQVCYSHISNAKNIQCSSDLVYFNLVMLKIVTIDHSSGYLPLSLTMIYVDGCPDSKESWDKAAEMKGCHEISYKCVGLFNDLGLEYHCLINPYNNATVEVCAPPQRIFGGNHYAS